MISLIVFSLKKELKYGADNLITFSYDKEKEHLRGENSFGQSLWFFNNYANCLTAALEEIRGGKKCGFENPKKTAKILVQLLEDWLNKLNELVKHEPQFKPNHEKASQLYASLLNRVENEVH